MTTRKTAEEWADEIPEAGPAVRFNATIRIIAAAMAEADRAGFERAKEACALTAERTAELAEKHLKGGDAAPALLMFSGAIRALPYAPPEEEPKP